MTMLDERREYLLYILQLDEKTVEELTMEFVDNEPKISSSV